MLVQGWMDHRAEPFISHDHTAWKMMPDEPTPLIFHSTGGRGLNQGCLEGTPYIPPAAFCSNPNITAECNLLEWNTVDNFCNQKVSSK